MITDILKLIAPGTPIRDGLENILKAKTGALIVISDTKEVLDLVDGGFKKFYMPIHNLFQILVLQQQKLELDIGQQSVQQNKQELW